LQLAPRLPPLGGSLVPGNLEALATAVELQHKVFRFGVPRLEVAKHNRIIFVGNQDKRIIGPKLQFGRFAETGQRHWHPNQLRHSKATEVRQRFGLEAAQVVLGHARADVTQVYAERDTALAVEVTKKIG
jgi:site-specific recombinase XerC